ncbi:hypothetical protein [Corynebacterium sp. HS2168-gen11]|uniref:hypothetical protein n=1 Tax=Corynebacterium sp. HS2168-gen11 TaxID=2974027 RepID=UPI00216AC4C0|nr:hypothetical protein [Corynebacterium sp. HS2168-gen11]MCS4535653.1 hypothetical protein [Corynebacterium sp. HS2168-gen11]
MPQHALVSSRETFTQAEPPAAPPEPTPPGETTRRVRIHIQATPFLRTLECEIPLVTTLGDALDEILRLAHAPIISLPWQCVTSAGTACSPAATLAELDIPHGSTIIVRPIQQAFQPTVVDATEAIETSMHARTGATDTALFSAAWTALACLGLLYTGTAIIGHLISPAAFASACCVVLALAAVLTKTAALLPGVCLMFAAAIVLNFPQLLSLRTLAQFQHTWAFVCLCIACGWILCAIIGAFVLPHPALTSAIAVVAISMLFLSIGIWIYRPSFSQDTSHYLSWVVPAHGFMLGILVLLHSGLPLLAAKLAGIKVPLLRTDVVKHEETADPHLAKRCSLVSQILSGASIGMAISVSVACAVIMLVSMFTSEDTLVAWGLFASLTVVFLFQAHRFQLASITWSLWIAAHMCLLTTIILAGQSHALPLFVITVAIVGALISARVLAPLIDALEPTTVIWWERLELLALTCCVPLSLSLAGVFNALRGLAL